MTFSTQPYVNLGTKVTDHLAPINATMFIATGTLVPVMDFVRPHFPYMSHVAAVVVLLFAVLLALKLFQPPLARVIPTSLVLCAGVSAAAFSVGAMASSRHAAQGGYIAAKSEDARALQSNLLRLERQTGDITTALQHIQSGRSEDPRVELRNIGVEWSEDGLRNSSRIGDVRALELFLRGGMSIYSTHDSNRTSFAVSAIANRSPRMKEQVQLLVQHGYGLNEARTVQAKADPMAPPNLYAYAKDIGNEEAAQLLANMGSDTSVYEPWKAKKPKPVVLPGI